MRSHDNLQSDNQSPANSAANRSRRLTRLLAFALRHDPGALKIQVDRNGWADLEALVQSARNRPSWQDLSSDEVEELVRGHSFARFEIQEGRIRALYGHSIRSIWPG